MFNNIFFQQKLLYILAPPLPLGKNSSELFERLHSCVIVLSKVPEKQLATFRLCIFSFSL